MNLYNIIIIFGQFFSCMYVVGLCAQPSANNDNNGYSVGYYYGCEAARMKLYI